MGKVAMSVLTKGLAVDFDRQGKKDMAVTSIWPAVVCLPVPAVPLCLLTFLHQSIESAATESAVIADQDIRSDLRKPVHSPPTKARYHS